jgi:DNA gyrase/topoisomerase IV subunit A
MLYSNPRPSGIRAIGLEDGDEVIGVRLTDGQQELILSTLDGQSIRFKEEQVRPTGRGTYGVVAMRLDKGDAVVSMEMLSRGASILTVSENGYGKRTEMEEYRLQFRGGKGVITMKATDKTGRVVGGQQVTDDDQLMLVTRKRRNRSWRNFHLAYRSLAWPPACLPAILVRLTDDGKTNRNYWSRWLGDRAGQLARTEGFSGNSLVPRRAEL